MENNQKHQVDSNVRKLLWDRYFPKVSEAKCPICGTRRISLIDGFEAAHIISDGGEDIDNLIPTCNDCNNSSKQQNLLKYKYEKFPRVNSTISWMPSIKSLLDEIETLKQENKSLKNTFIKSEQYIKSKVVKNIKDRNKYEFLDAVEDVLKMNLNKPLTPKEIWNEINKHKLYDSRGLTPWATISSDLITDIRNNKNSIFIRSGERPAKYSLKSFKPNEEDKTL